MRVIVIGDAGLDVMARHDGPIVYGDDVRAKVRVAGGGAGTNTALWLGALAVSRISAQPWLAPTRRLSTSTAVSRARDRLMSTCAE
jgi:sugar/nucleoside kinase (ribokinase family)